MTMEQMAAQSADRVVATLFSSEPTTFLLEVLERGRQFDEQLPGNLAVTALNGAIERELQRRQGGRYDA